jgi:hypothetical protein
MTQKTKSTTKKLSAELPLSKQIQSFVTRLLNSRGKLLTAGIGNTKDAMYIKHEKLKKAFDYACSIKTTEAGWIAFITKWEATCRYLIICNKSRAKFEVELFKIINRI